MTQKKSPTYQELRGQLDDVVLKLQDPEADIDEALKLYEQGLSLTKQIEQYLRQAELRVSNIRAEYDGGGTEG
jgi:exodeoxyribonuclease VII small subunit